MMAASSHRKRKIALPAKKKKGKKSLKKCDIDNKEYQNKLNCIKKRVKAI